MSVHESYTATNPFGFDDDCAKFTIDDTTVPFMLCAIMSVDQTYTFSMWLKSDDVGQMTVAGQVFPSTTEWVRHSVTFKADVTDLELHFDTEGTYYIFHPQLEIGNMVTDWTPAPEDTDQDIDDSADGLRQEINSTNERVTLAEAALQILENCISTLVRDKDGQSMMTQTSSGWMYSMGDTQTKLSELSASLSELQEVTGSTKATIEALENAVQNHTDKLEYVNISDYHTVILEPQSLSFTGTESYWSCEASPDHPLIIDEVYTVIWGDMEYSLTAKEYAGERQTLVYVGNLTIPQLGADTGESFFIGYDESTSMLYIYASTEELGTDTSITATKTICVYQDEPCIELGESDSDFKLLITNTRIMFMNGENELTYINTNGLVTKSIEVENEIKMDTPKDATVKGQWVWKVRANGNLGLMWKEVSS